MDEIEANATITFPSNCSLTPEEAVKAAAGILQSGHSFDGADVAYAARLPDADPQFTLPDDGRLRVSVSNGYAPDIDDIPESEKNADDVLRQRAISTHQDCLEIGDWHYAVTIGNVTIASAMVSDNNIEMEIENDRLYHIQESAGTGATLYALSEGRPPVEFPVAMLTKVENSDVGKVIKALHDGDKALGGTQITVKDKEASDVLMRIAKTFQDDGYIDHLKNVSWVLLSKDALTNEGVSRLFGSAGPKKPSCDMV